MRSRGNLVFAYEGCNLFIRPNHIKSLYFIIEEGSSSVEREILSEIGDPFSFNKSMEHWINRFCFLFSSSALVFFLLTGLSASSSSSSISGYIFESHATTGRNLLQAKKSCPVNFEFLNYTIITGQCKGPRYPPNICCGALKDFACPYVDELNDLSNDCASTMFSYINLYGKYPPGLFASECREGKQGLECPATAPTTSANASGSQIECNPSSLLMLISGFPVLLFQLL